MARRLPLLALLLLCALALGSCGEADVDQARVRAKERIAEVRRDIREERKRIKAKVEQVLGDLEKAIPEARRTDPVGRSRGRTEPGTIGAFMEDVLTSVDRYWTTTLRESGAPEPRVGFVAVAPGDRVRTACGASAGDDAAFYCPADDTIYVAEVFASALYEGVLRGLPGESTGARAEGDFAVAYVLAHEYAHNVQQELGLFGNRVSPTAEPFELQADCLAGTWANSVYQQGLLDEGDLEEATNTALAVGDFDYGNAQHHGTPQQRRDALLDGYETGDPSRCSRYVPEL